jgi:hypothetical protein
MIGCASTGSIGIGGARVPVPVGVPASRASDVRVPAFLRTSTKFSTRLYTTYMGWISPYIMLVLVLQYMYRHPAVWAVLLDLPFILTRRWTARDPGTPVLYLTIQSYNMATNRTHHSCGGRSCARLGSFLLLEGPRWRSAKAEAATLGLARSAALVDRHTRGAPAGLERLVHGLGVGVPPVRELSGVPRLVAGEKALLVARDAAAEAEVGTGSLGAVEWVPVRRPPDG